MWLYCNGRAKEIVISGISAGNNKNIEKHLETARISITGCSWSCGSLTYQFSIAHLWNQRDWPCCISSIWCLMKAANRYWNRLFPQRSLDTSPAVWHLHETSIHTAADMPLSNLASPFFFKLWSKLLPQISTFSTEIVIDDDRRCCAKSLAHLQEPRRDRLLQEYDI